MNQILETRCAVGCRVGIVMINFSSIIYFRCYNRCKDLGLSPENIADHLKGLLEFSKTTVPISQIPNYIKQKADEKGKLAEEIEKWKEQIEILELEKSDMKALRDAALQNDRMTVAELKWYSDVIDDTKTHI